MPVSVAEARQRLLELLATADPATDAPPGNTGAGVSPPRLVNLYGPLGVGKSRLLAAVSAEVAGRTGIPPVIIDGVDSDRRAHTAARMAAQAGTATVVIAGRRPLAGRADWATRPVVPVGLAPWASEELDALCADQGVAPGVADLAVRLAGGIPLIAVAVCRAAHGGDDPGATGALADQAASDILRRLATEAADLRVIGQVAALDGADEDLLTLLVRRPATAFARLRRLSVVRGDHHGLRVEEPYRTVFDLAYRWRNPLARADLAVRATELRFRQLVTVTDPRQRARISDQIMHLSARPGVQRDIFAVPRSGLAIRPAHEGDAATMERLTRRWADEEGLGHRRAERMLGLWLEGDDHGFFLAVDAADRPLGMVNLSPLTGGAPILDPLLQQFAGTLCDSPGLVVGMMAMEPSAQWAQPVLVRHILRGAITTGRLVVSTPWTPYQQMSARFGLRRLGSTRDDVYRCGRQSGVYTRAFAPDMLPAWLRRMQEEASTLPDAQVRAALRDLRSPARLAASPLAATDPPGTAGADLAARLTAAIELLAASPTRAEAEAAEILTLYYLRRAGGHDALAHRLHLSRATYFRRLEYGVRRVTLALTGA